MPEFILDTGGVVKSDDGARVAFYALPILTQGYIKAAFFTNTEGSREAGTYDPENGSALPEEVGYDDLAPSALDTIMADCAAFAEQAADLLAQAEERGYDAERAGHDFWLTRNGHGAGFWDRDELGLTGDDAEAVNALYRRCTEAYEANGDTPEYRALYNEASAENHRRKADSLGQRLTALAKAFGESDVYLGDDDKVYVS